MTCAAPWGCPQNLQLSCHIAGVPVLEQHVHFQRPGPGAPKRAKLGELHANIPTKILETVATNRLRNPASKTLP